MLEKRYEIFVSSTFTDLKEERAAVSQIIVEMGHMPIGMEMFPARSTTAWNAIEKMIEKCDYYVLIIKTWYGSTDESGKSFTWREYDFAQSLGIPTLAFIHEEPEKVASELVEHEAAASLANFRSAVDADFLRKKWTTTESLKMAVVLSLHNEFTESPRHGWVRADSIPPDYSRALIETREALDKANAELLAMRNESEVVVADASKDDDPITLDIRVEILPGEDLPPSARAGGSEKIPLAIFEITTTWNILFEIVAEELLLPVDTNVLVMRYSKWLDDLRRDDIDSIRMTTTNGSVRRRSLRFTEVAYQAILRQFQAIGWIVVDRREVTSTQFNRSRTDSRILVSLTPLGKKKALTLLAVRTTASEEASYKAG